MRLESSLSKTWTPPTIEVVFARTSIQTADPIITVLDQESQVAIVQEFFRQTHPEVEITWSDHKIEGPGSTGDTIHLVTQVSVDSPVVIGAFTKKKDARAMVNREIIKGSPRSFVRVQSFKIGIIVPGTPWLADVD